MVHFVLGNKRWKKQGTEKHTEKQRKEGRGRESDIERKRERERDAVLGKGIH